ncbi:MAG: CheR family methyltransferase [Sedimenticola sp.]
MDRSSICDENNPVLDSIAELITSKSGIVITNRDKRRLCSIIMERLIQTGLKSIPDYGRMLMKIGSEDPEWLDLLHQLIVGETYFFRDKGQTDLLKDYLLPKLVERNRARRELRIWSAGCSTGEELYSIAILLAQIPGIKDSWNLHLLGTDINRRALEKARAGVFGDWSFRNTDSAAKQRYFREHDGHWHITNSIKEMVTFKYHNMVTGAFPVRDDTLHDMDLIICRNVFIYFSPETTGMVLPKLVSTLKQGGYLLAGHNELQGHEVEGLKAESLPGSYVYQRLKDSRRSRQVQKQTVVTAPYKKKTVHAQQRFEITNSNLEETKPELKKPVLDEARGLFQDRNYTAVINLVRGVPEDSSDIFETQHLVARAQANLGRYEEARQTVMGMIAIRQFDPIPYYLLAHIDEAMEAREEAKQWLHKVIYLSPDFVTAYLDLATLYSGEGNRSRARQLRLSALNLLKSLPADKVVGPYNTEKAGELLERLMKTIHEGS